MFASAVSPVGHLEDLIGGKFVAGLRYATHFTRSLGFILATKRWQFGYIARTLTGAAAMTRR